jgi:hypothetical protein
MKKLRLLFLMALTGLAIVGCIGPQVKAPTRAGGGGYTIAVLSDRGVTPELDPDRANQYNQVGAWMEQDLLRMLRKAGYQARLIGSRGEFSGANGEYLLSVRIVTYRPGSKAARMVVGFGAGATSLDTHYELYGAGPQPLLAEDHGVGSSIDWYQVVQKLNQQMVDAVSRKLAETGGRG